MEKKARERSPDNDCVFRRDVFARQVFGTVMFVKKDTRKVLDILSDEDDERTALKLGRRCV